MPCYFNGQLTGDSRAGCAATPGKYWEESNIFTGYSQGEGEKRNFITPSTSLLGSDPMSLPPVRKLGTTFSGSGAQDPNRVNLFYNPDTDDFGNPLLNADFEGNTHFELFRDRAINKHNYDAFNEIDLGPVDRTKTTQPRMIQTKDGLRHMTEDEMAAQDRENVRQKFLNTFPMVSSWFGEYSDVNKAKNDARGGTDWDLFTQGLDKNVNKVKQSSAEDDLPIVYGHPEVVAPITEAPKDKTKPDTTKPTTTKPDTVFMQGKKDSMGLLGDEPTVDYEIVPENKGEIDSGLSNLWSNMQSKDWWFNPVEGGAGGWDNRLFRLGEMMSYMGTPLSKRGDNPAERWQQANLKNKELISAASKKKTATPLAISSSDVEPYLTRLIDDEFGSMLSGIGFGMDAEEIAAEANILAANVRKRVRDIETKNPGKRADIRKIADDEFNKLKEREKNKE